MGLPQPEGSAKHRAVSCLLIGCQTSDFLLTCRRGPSHRGEEALQLRPRARKVRFAFTDSPSPPKSARVPRRILPKFFPKTQKPRYGRG